MTSNILHSHFKKSTNDLFALVSEEECKQLLEWNNTFADYDRDVNLIEMFEQTVAANPFKVAIRFDNKILTYRELNEKANQLAFHLNQTLTPHSSNIIGLCLDPSFELLISIMAILKTGKAYLPLDSSSPSERLNLMLNDAKAACLITSAKYKDYFSNQTVINIEEDEQVISHWPINNLEITINNNDLAYVIYTSGSTGIPKGVMVKHKNVNNFIHWFGQAIPFNATDIFDFSSSIAFDFAVAMTLFPLIKGFEIAICTDQNKKDPLNYINHLIQHKVTIVKLTPSYFRQFKEFVEDQYLFSDLRVIIFGGEKLYKSDIIDWLDRFPNQMIFNEYGPTETTVATSWMIFNDKNISSFNETLPIGQPALNTQMLILNNNLQLVPVGKVGEIFVGGESVAAGYLNQPEMTAKKFIINPFVKNLTERLYRTGDLAKYLPSGQIEFIGRVDQQVKIRGFRVELDEINICLSNHPEIKQAATIIRENETTLEKQLVTYCIPKTNIKPANQDLRKYLLTHLPDYMLPTQFIFIEEFPLNSNGKLDSNKLALIESQPDDDIHYDGSDFTILLRKIWKKVLQIPNMDDQDNFFELGGNSLSAARILNELRKHTGKDIHLQDLYDYPTITQLSELLKTQAFLKVNWNTSSESEPFQQYGKSIPLSDMQLLFWIMEKFSSKLKVPNIVKRVRLDGKINKAKLTQSLHQLLKRHEILSYCSSFYPIQHRQDQPAFTVNAEDLTKEGALTTIKKLQESFDYLQNSLDWSQGTPRILVRLFYLEKDTTEIQLAMAHTIADDISLDIILNDLSAYYLGKDALSLARPFKEYIQLEQNSLSTLERDIHFWETYLKDATHLCFADKDIMSKKSISAISTTTYFPIPVPSLDHMLDLSGKLKISLADMICAVVALTLRDYVSNPAINNMIINFVKSTRENTLFDNTVGLFIRNDLIKIRIGGEVDFFQIVKNIEHSRTHTAPYQFCPGIIKLASSLKKDWDSKKLWNKLIDSLALLISNIFPASQMHPKVLSRYGKVFIARSNNFIVNVNILNSFFIHNNSDKNLFGFKCIETEPFFNERIAAQNVLDICFERDESFKPYLIICSNIQPELREKIANQIICNMDPFSRA